MHEAFGERMKPAGALEPDARRHGRLGRKNGRGFYRYHEGHKAGVDDSVYPLLGVRPGEAPTPIWCERRLVYAMLNEAAMACAEKRGAELRAMAISARSSGSASPPSAADRSG